MIENVIVSVEEHKENKKVWMFIRAKQTKKILFEGQIAAKASTIKVINNKAQNLSATVIEIKDQKPKIASIKLQFLSNEDGSEFLKIFGDKVHDLESPPQ